MRDGLHHIAVTFQPVLSIQNPPNRLNIMKVFAIGASRNIGYYAAQRLLSMHSSLTQDFARGY